MANQITPAQLPTFTTYLRLARAEVQMVYGAARELHNERTRTTLKHSTCSHKWWETLKDDLMCEAVYSCSQGVRRWFGGGAC